MYVARLWFWCCFVIVVACIRDARPVYMDGGGPMPSWYWTRPPAPGLGDYMERESYYDALYWIPYILSGLLLTITCLSVVPRLLQRLGAPTRAPFWVHFAATLTILIAYSGISDLGSSIGWWESPVFFHSVELEWYTIRAYGFVFLPAPILSGCTAFVRAYRRQHVIRDSPDAVRPRVRD